MQKKHIVLSSGRHLQVPATLINKKVFAPEGRLDKVIFCMCAKYSQYVPMASYGFVCNCVCIQECEFTNSFPSNTDTLTKVLQSFLTFNFGSWQ